MTRKVKRELTARLVSIVLMIGPLIGAIIGSIVMHKCCGWGEGPIAGLIIIGTILSATSIILLSLAWEKVSDVRKYPNRGYHSLLLEWIEEPEKVELPKKQPREGAWKENE